MISADAWTLPARLAGDLAAAQRDLGLLGSERLAGVLSRLDDLKIRTDERRRAGDEDDLARP